MHIPMYIPMHRYPGFQVWSIPVGGLNRKPSGTVTWTPGSEYSQAAWFKIVSSENENDWNMRTIFAHGATAPTLPSFLLVGYPDLVGSFSNDTYASGFNLFLLMAIGYIFTFTQSADTNIIAV